MDEIGLVLERVAVSQTGHVVVPPPSVLVYLSRRRAAFRTVASSALVVAMVVAFLLALAGVGLASDTVHPAERVAAESVASR